VIANAATFRISLLDEMTTQRGEYMQQSFRACITHYLLQSIFGATQIESVWQGIGNFVNRTSPLYANDGAQPSGPNKEIHAKEEDNQCPQDIRKDIDSQKLPNVNE
jgi:hypothetical protein